MKKVLTVTLLIGLFVAYVKYVGLSLAAECEEGAKALLASIDEANSCEIDNDCRIYVLSCPFSCTTTMHYQKADAVIRAINAHQKECHMYCPDCPKTRHGVRCIDQKCVVTG